MQGSRAPRANSCSRRCSFIPLVHVALGLDKSAQVWYSIEMYLAIVPANRLGRKRNPSFGSARLLSRFSSSPNDRTDLSRAPASAACPASLRRSAGTLVEKRGGTIFVREGLGETIPTRTRSNESQGRAKVCRYFCLIVTDRKKQK